MARLLLNIFAEPLIPMDADQTVQEQNDDCVEERGRQTFQGETDDFQEEQGQQTFQGENDDCREERGDAPSEVELTRAEEARQAAMATLGIMTENLRTYLLSRR